MNLNYIHTVQNGTKKQRFKAASMLKINKIHLNTCKNIHSDTHALKGEKMCHFLSHSQTLQCCFFLPQLSRNRWLLTNGCNLWAWSINVTSYYTALTAKDYFKTLVLKYLGCKKYSSNVWTVHSTIGSLKQILCAVHIHI